MKLKSLKLFDIINLSLLTVFSIAAIYPFWNIYVYSFNDGTDAMVSPLYLWPREFTLENFRIAFQQPGILNAYKISILRTVVGTIMGLAACSSLGFVMTKRKLPGYKFFSYFFFATFLVSGGIVPYYLTLRQIGLLNTFWVLVIPGIYSYWNIILFRSFFETIHESIEESAKIDGASYLRIYLQIFVPLSKPVFAALALFTAIGLWNDWFAGLFYIKNQDLVPLQSLLQKLMTEADMLKKMMEITGGQMASQWKKVTPYSIRLAVVVMTITPIIMVYPFLQKYIVKGTLFGAVKE